MTDQEARRLADRLGVTHALIGLKRPKEAKAKSTCAFCEYFDGGGMRRVERARQGGKVLHGDCLNHLSPRFETTSAQDCRFFVLDTWPDG